MVKMLISTGNLLFFNLDGNVGLNSPNKRDDVDLVQFGFFAKSKSSQTPEDLRPIFAKVQPGSSYSGQQNDPLTEAILAHQRKVGGVQDGHVSKINNAAVGYDFRSRFLPFVLVPLVNAIFDLNPNQYPRIDLNPSCPSVLREVVKGFFVR